MSFLKPEVRKLLNDFHKTQPGLTLSDRPYGDNGIKLGDIIEALWDNIQSIAAKLDVEAGLAADDYEAGSTGNDENIDQLG